jgi:hypothetical protein
MSFGTGHETTHDDSAFTGNRCYQWKHLTYGLWYCHSAILAEMKGAQPLMQLI